MVGKWRDRRREKHCQFSLSRMNTWETAANGGFDIFKVYNISCLVPLRHLPSWPKFIGRGKWWCPGTSHIFSVNIQDGSLLNSAALYSMKTSFSVFSRSLERDRYRRDHGNEVDQIILMWLCRLGLSLAILWTLNFFTVVGRNGLACAFGVLRCVG